MVAEKKLLAKVERASEKAKKEFEEFEKRDLKVREDLKHNKAKIKKLTAKVGGEKKKVREQCTYHDHMIIFKIKVHTRMRSMEY